MNKLQERLKSGRWKKEPEVFTPPPPAHRKRGRPRKENAGYFDHSSRNEAPTRPDREIYTSPDMTGWNMSHVKDDKGRLV